LIDLGHEVIVFTGKKAAANMMPNEVERYHLMNNTFCINEKPDSLPLRCAECFLSLFKEPFLTLRALNFFKFAREALSLNVFYKARNFNKRGDFDIVQCHFGTNGNVGAMLKEAGFRFKLVTMFHGYDIRKALSDGKDIYKKVREYGDCFLSISDYSKKNLMDMGFDEKKIRYHPVGIDLSEIDFNTRKISAEKKKKIKILTVARLVWEKGLEYGIKAFNLAKRRFPELDIEYGIVGKGPLLEKLEATAGALGLADNITFYGACDHYRIIAFLRNAHIFLLPSVVEVLPVSLLEAQASGLPVVATDVGSVRQAMVDGKSGYMAASKDVTDIAEKLNMLIEDHEKWPYMSAAGREFVEKNYDIRRLNLKLESIYRRLLKQRYEKG
jgi:colanic acid/amylovoran biosynthesis glycosyltransferase